MDKLKTQYLNKIYKIESIDGVEYKISMNNCAEEGNKLASGDVCLKLIKLGKNVDIIQDIGFYNSNDDITMLK